MVLPLYCGLALSVLAGGFLLYTTASLHFAVEAAVRCSSITTTKCADTTTVQTYATDHYYGPNSPSPTFTATSAACGHQVSGSVTFTFDTGVKT